MKNKFIKEIIKSILFKINKNLYLFSKIKKIKESNSIVIIRTDNIGDFIIWLWEAKKYKEYYKNKKLILVCNKSYEKFAKSLIGYFDEVIPIDIKKYHLNIFYRYHILNLLRKEKYEKVIVPVYSRNLITESIVQNIFSVEKIGIDGDCSNLNLKLLKIGNKFYTKLIFIKSKMELYNNLEFSNNLFNENKKIEQPELNLKFEIKNNLIEKIQFFEKNYCIFFLGSNVKNKCWELEKFLKVAEKIKDKYNIVLLGGKNEIILGKKFMNQFSDKIKLHNFIGMTNLNEVVYFIKNSKFVLSNDSFSGHLAILLNIPNICIVGGGHFGRFFPYPQKILNNKVNSAVVYKKMKCFNCNWQCRYLENPWRCIRKITVEDVLKEIKKLKESKK